MFIYEEETAFAVHRNGTVETVKSKDGELQQGGGGDYALGPLRTKKCNIESGEGADCAPQDGQLYGALLSVHLVLFATCGLYATHRYIRTLHLSEIKKKRVYI